MISRTNVIDYIRILKNTIRKHERELAKARDREELLVEVIRRSQKSHERDILHIAVFHKRYRSN